MSTNYNYSNNGAGTDQPKQIPDSILPRYQEDSFSQAELVEILTKRARALARPHTVEAKGITLDLMVFTLNGQQYGMQVRHVRGIYPWRELTPVPRTPGFVSGVFSARGHLISVVDLACFIGLAPTMPSAESKIIFIAVEENGIEVGFLVESVVDIVTVYQDSLAPSLATQIGGFAHYTQGIAPGMLTVLDIHKLVQDPRFIVREELL